MSTTNKDHNWLLTEYEETAAKTDQFAANDTDPILLGLFGEVGSVMSTAKKLHREKSAFEAGYRDDAEEEFGDVLWYAAALCQRCSIGLSDLISEVLAGGNYDTSLITNADPHYPVAQKFRVPDPRQIHPVLLELGARAGAALKITENTSQARPLLKAFLQTYLEALQVVGVSFGDVLARNTAKTTGRFLPPDPNALPDFDAGFPVDEQIPRNFEIEIFQRSDGKACLRWQNVIIGDPLSDNIRDPDGYRFHDVFHFAFAAILHWSPTFRGLIRHKRKSDPETDEAEDGGRASVVDEGISACIFSYAKKRNFFEGHESVSFDLLKAISTFVKGYEVEQCPLNLWEAAILQGYAVFRSLRQQESGIIVGDRTRRTLEYKPLQGASQ
ncbi:MAG: nucleoside triphosphate pyrophosphohydrolase family protein [Rhodobacteraceae bacterium]|nr:nucleoside triphosphate pyrophosphohydrolase family protein [Paracoccaceae bacterium]MCY4328056.1 nucleoside triphosphate pyrophosphohydrolase family protein [Paracoccaceae bacterium]